MKFRVRVYNTETKEWEISPDGFDMINQQGIVELDDSYSEDDTYIDKFSDVKVESYVGMNDMNNVEVYEGDRVHLTHYGWDVMGYEETRERTGTIMFYAGAFWIVPDNQLLTDEPIYAYQSEFEVIG